MRSLWNLPRLPLFRLSEQPPFRISAVALALAWLASTAPAAGQAGPLGIYRQLWTGLPSVGNTLAALTNTANNPNWPNSPDPAYTTVFTNFETEVNSGLTQYGQRLRAFLIPPTNGNYVFWISSDDSSELWLGGDENQGNATRLAWVSGWTSSRAWGNSPSQQSAPVVLEGGRRYYLEALMQQGGGGDNLAVRWQLPNGTIEEPMTAASDAGTRMVPFDGASTRPGVYQQATSTTALEGSTVRFWVLATNGCPVSYQWRANGVNLAGATNAFCVISNVSVAGQSGQVYTCVLANSAGVVTNAPSTLTVIPDTVPPTVVRAANVGTAMVQVVFSEPVETATAADPTHYLLTNGLAISGASLAPDAVTVILNTGTLTYGSNYTLVLNSVRDRARVPNTIATNTAVDFVASAYATQDIGNPPLASAITSYGTTGLDVAAAGTDLGGSADQCGFAYQLRAGDFDIGVRLAALALSDVWAKAGIMARESLDPGSRFAAALSTPTLAGCLFEARDPASSQAVASGNCPANYPYTWLRLKRAANTFTGFVSYDGQTWTALGKATIAMPSQIYLGFAVSSHDSSLRTLAQFRDISALTNAAETKALGFHEPLGPSSRRTPLVFSEIMYKPARRTDTNNLEFVELFNSQAWFEDISGYQILTPDMNYSFPPGTTLAGGAFLVIAAAPQSIRDIYGCTNVTGPYSGTLKGSGPLQLLNKQGAVLLEVPYLNVPPWPAAAAGAGHSLVLANPTYGEADPRAWDISDTVGGSPGQMDTLHPGPLRNVVINEFLAHTDPPDYDYIELYNHANQPVNISGCILTDSPDTNKFVVPAGTIIPARGFVWFSEVNLNFGLSSFGETIYLKSPDQTRVLDAVPFEGQENGVAMGRSPDGGEQFYRLSAHTPGTNNASPRLSDIVINELMYKPISGNDDDQYVELYNRGTNRVDLGMWQVGGPVSFTIPSNTIVLPDHYLVVARNAANLRSNYANLNLTNCLGDFSGKLSHKGARVTLAVPHYDLTTNGTQVTTAITMRFVVNEVTYGTGGRWGQWSAGGGSSLELVDPHADTRLAPGWADSDETAKAPWTTVEYTGVLDLGNGNYPPDQLQLFLQDGGECLVDNVEVFRLGGPNLITNPSFDTGPTGWYFQGTQWRSGVDATGGDGGGACLHVRASARGDTGANRIRTVLSSALAAGDTATLRARARWLKGTPEILLRLHGNWLEAPGRLALPANCGTPGARNSRYTGNAGPAIVGLSHSPVLPAAGQAIVVSARVSDPDGVAAVQLSYRNDTAAGGAVTLSMRDNGMGGDDLAGDGVYSATVPGQAAGTIVAFYIRATDAAAAPAASTFPSDAPARECLVGFGENVPAGALGTYRMWVSQANVNSWANREHNSNDPVDATFVYGNSRVVYNMETLYSGSPFHTGAYNSPVGNPCDYVMSFPADDRVLGAADFLLATTGNLGNDNTAQAEQTAFWILHELGVPSLYRRYVYGFVNGISRGAILEDSQQPNADLVAEYFPADSKGHLHKLDDWFEFDDAGSGFNNVDATLDNFTTTGGAKKAARYRWNWRPRAVQDTPNDFTNLFNLVDALHAAQPEPYNSAVPAQADVEEWMRTFAVERLVGNWDSFAYNRGKNMYAYKPGQGPWQMLAFDIDFVLQLGDGPGTGLFGGQDSSVNSMRAHPPFLRAYWRAFQDAVNGPLQDSRVNPFLDAKYNALRANGLPVAAPVAIKTYITSRRTFLQSQLATVAASFTVNPVTVNNDVAIISGFAPVAIKTLVFNGIAWPVTWSTVTAWSASVPLRSGTNLISIVGLDSFGQPAAGASNNVSAVCNSTVPSPAGRVVLNEIMFDPAFPNAAYVELFNTSPTTTFDLSGWQLRGLSYTFPAGSLLGPNKYLVLAADQAAFSTAYGASVPVFDTFGGALQANGETLTLVRPGTNAASDLVITKVRYSGALPWPTNALETGSSLQLIDPLQDNWRVANWGVTQSNVSSLQWQYVTLTGTAPRSLFFIGMSTAGDCYLDDLKLVAGAIPEAGPNCLVNGDFESPLNGTWTVSTNMTNSAISTAIRHSGNASLHVVATSGGPRLEQAIWQNTVTLVTNGTYTLSYWYLPSTNATTSLLRVSGTSPNSGQVYCLHSLQPPPILFLGATPGTANSVAAPVAPFQPLWINELQAENLTGPTNSAGQRGPWIELYNPTTNSVSLNGLYLAPNYTNLAQWPFPPAATIGPRQFKVIFTDGQTNLSTLNELHTGFLLPGGGGSLALSRTGSAGAPEVLDYINYTNLTANRSYGSFPDGQCFDRRQFVYSTPGATNNGSSAPLSVVINEWMAANTNTLRDPVTGKFEDWFELYNYGTNTAELGGYFLTHSLTNQFEFQIPDGYAIPPQGFLLVWADKEPTNGTPDLHADFKLSKSGSSIGLYGVDGRPVDYVVFGPQTANISEGRYPDGGAGLHFMPVPTPATNNILPNTPPVLTPPGDKWVYLGETLQFYLQANDDDQPSQLLAFSLDQAPANAAVGAASGLFVWAPTSTQVPGTNVVSVRVTDNGIPPLSDIRTFTVTALSVPAVSLLGVQANDLTLGWPSCPGRSYRLQYKDDLSAAEWTTLPPDLLGTGNPLSVTIDVSEAPSRYYRMLVVQ